MKRVAAIGAGLVVLCSASLVLAQNSADASGGKVAEEESEAGIPVTDPLVLEKCGGCHALDEKGNLSRISWSRTTPEGWSQVIKRMVRLNGVQLTPEDARSIVKYLSRRHGLAPEEARPVMYIPERRIVDESIPNDTLRQACASCHAFGQPLSWRRSKTEWRRLQDLHVAMFSQADVQFRRQANDGQSPATPASRGGAPQGPTAGQVALEFFSKSAPLHSAEWSAWQSRMRDPGLAGEWLVTATSPGRGRFVGKMTISADEAADEFKTAVRLVSLADGSLLTRTGTAVVYGGYSWRGRSSGGARGSGPDDPSSEARETLWIAPSQSSAEGRWFWGDYQEFGFDVKLTRATAAPSIIAVAPYALKAGTSGARLRVFGHNLPANLTAADINIGSGVKVVRVVSSGPTELVADVDVTADAVVGNRDVQVASAVLENALPIYRTVDYLKVAPETGLARLGGQVYRKGYQQFEAIGFAVGSDGKPNTADDIRLGPIDVSWKIEEFASVTYDDDKNFVGTLSPNALFTPAAEGPNPARRFSRNNYGEVWVEATAKADKDKFGKPLTGRAYLVVTVPTYQRWDQPEISQ